MTIKKALSYAIVNLLQDHSPGVKDVDIEQDEKDVDEC